MKLLITGSSGQVGQEISPLALTEKHEVFAFDHATLDITNKNKIEDTLKKIKPDIFINAAAYTKVDTAETDEEAAFSINTKAVGYISKLCQKYSIPLIHISTDYVFDGSKNEPYIEIDDVNPINIYGKSKYLGEQSIRENLSDHIILRTSWVFGNGGNNFVKTILELAKHRDSFEVISDQFGSPTPAKSIAEVIVLIVNSIDTENTTKYGTYHYSGDCPTNWYNFAVKICKIALKSGAIKHMPKITAVKTSDTNPITNRPKYSILNTEKINYVFNVKAPDWENELVKLINI